MGKYETEFDRIWARAHGHVKPGEFITIPDAFFPVSVNDAILFADQIRRVVAVTVDGRAIVKKYNDLVAVDHRHCGSVCGVFVRRGWLFRRWVFVPRGKYCGSKESQ